MTVAAAVFAGEDESTLVGPSVDGVPTGWPALVPFGEESAAAAVAALAMGRLPPHCGFEHIEW